ncbi:MAG: hypothetical protein ABI343_04170 [Burkholderiaceae bacterium]
MPVTATRRLTEAVRLDLAQRPAARDRILDIAHHVAEARQLHRGVFKFQIELILDVEGHLGHADRIDAEFFKSRGLG